MIKKYRKLPVVIEAVQYDGIHTGLIRDLDEGINSVVEPVDGGLFIETLEGRMEVSKGDYVIKGVNGELYPCKPDIFLKTYEVVEP